MSIQRFIQIDEEGQLSSSGLRVADENYGISLLENLRVEDRGYTTTFQNERVTIEAFDQPLVARHIEILNAQTGRALFAYGFAQNFKLSQVRSDMWDRFHARTTDHNIPFVFSRSAQMEFFNAAEEFDDESITIQKTKLIISDINQSADDPNQPKFWSQKYESWQKQETEKPGWELDGPALPLESILTQIKIPRSRIVNLGCGTGHDSAFLSERGHIVTGVDWSENAIGLAENKYGQSKNLRFVHDEAFDFANRHPSEFDVVFEHTFFCAIDPKKRNALINGWKKMLIPEGHLLAIFFILDQVGGPPFGTTEWEIRESLKDHFDFLFWTRWRHSSPGRMGRELVIYAKKRG